ncbi:MAG: aminotransferase class IV [Gammaproteobacteria bacterium]
MRVCYLDGQYLPLAEARVSVLDRGFIFGDAVYEVIPVIEGQLFALTEHLTRLANSLAATEIANPFDGPSWQALLEALVAANGGGNQSLYLQVTRGVAERDHAFPVGLEPTVFAMCKPQAMSGGLSCVSAVTLDDNRWGRCDIKSTALLPNVLLRNQAIRRGAYEAILLRDGLLTEGAASNVFVVRDGVVQTPPPSALLLPGVTRALLLDVMRRSGEAVEECAVAAAALHAADEVWITSSSRDLVCVSELDGRPVGGGRHYAVAERVLAAFQAWRATGL